MWGYALYVWVRPDRHESLSIRVGSCEYIEPKAHAHAQAVHKPNSPNRLQQIYYHKPLDTWRWVVYNGFS